MTSENLQIKFGEFRYSIDNNFETYVEYARYWHGYSFIIKLLMLMFDLDGIRNLFTILLIGLSIILLYLINKKLGKMYVIIFSVAFCMIDYFLCGLTLQGVLIMILMQVSSIFILHYHNNLKKYIYGLFLILGMLTCYLDLLTTPIITLFIPLIIYLLLENKDSNLSLLDNVKILAKISCVWGISYILTELTKLIIVDLIYHNNTLQKSFEQIIYRTISNDLEKYHSFFLNFNVFDTIMANVKLAFGGPSIILFIGLIVYILNLLLKNKRKNNLKFNASSLIYLIIAIVPFVWYILFKNHSYQHAFFTYRNLIITIIGFSTFLFNVLKKGERKKI